MALGLVISQNKEIILRSRIVSALNCRQKGPLYACLIILTRDPPNPVSLISHGDCRQSQSARIAELDASDKCLNHP